MQVLIYCVLLILGFVSPCLCTRSIKVDGTNNNIYNVMDYGARGDGKSDDTLAFFSAWNHTCEAQGAATLIIPSKSFLVNNLILTGACKATSINIQLIGTIIAPPKEAWKDKSYWIRIQYINGLTIDGRGTGKIDGYGSTWWQCKKCFRPTALFFHSCNNLIISHLRMSNTPGAHAAINGCNGATISNVVVDSPGNSPNTDGFDISVSKNIFIKDSTIKGGDDCIAINGGSSYINVTNVACGPGHGISIGSLGKYGSNETVEDVYVRNCSFTDTTNGARIKTFPGGTGHARRITFEQIQLTNVKNPIIIDQHYGVYITTDSAVEVSGVTYRGINGTSASDIAIKLDCMGCSNIVLDKINIVSSQQGKEVNAFCKNFHGTITSTVPKVICN